MMTKRIVIAATVTAAASGLGVALLINQGEVSAAPLATAEACIAVTGAPEHVVMRPFQPRPDDMEFTGRIHDTGVEGFQFSMYGNSQKTILIEGVPFSRYWQLEDPNQFVFHPVVFGRFVFNQADKPGSGTELARLTARVGTALPDNGGTAFYYPNHYPLNRMSGPDLVYSAISQSEILAGYLHHERVHPEEETAALTEAVKRALLYPHAKGGTQLEQVAFLELPLFRSNPEIILNGWLHALLHLNDYAQVKSDAAAARIVERHLQFFSDHHAVWYDEQRDISRYSETSPHQIIVKPSSPDQTYVVVYDSRVEPLGDYAFVPVMDLEREYSGFDTRIVHISKSNQNLTMVVTCSGLFDTWIVSTAPFSCRVRDGGYDPMRAAPTGKGTWHTIPSAATDGSELTAPLHRLKVHLDDHELIRGYPTNFAKANGKNFYHGQHIVALEYLAAAGHFDNPQLKVDLARIADQWRANTGDFAYRELADFEPLQKVLDAINRGKVLTPFTKIEQLGLEEWAK